MNIKMLLAGMGADKQQDRFFVMNIALGGAVSFIKEPDLESEPVISNDVATYLIVSGVSGDRGIKLGGMPMTADIVACIILDCSVDTYSIELFDNSDDAVAHLGDDPGAVIGITLKGSSDPLVVRLNAWSASPPDAN